MRILGTLRNSVTNRLRHFSISIKRKLIKYLSRNLVEEDKPVSRAEMVEAIQKKLRNPGITCPKCNLLIKTDFIMLLSGNPIVCPRCLLKLSVNREKSKETLEVLNNVKSIQEKINSLKTFKR